MDTNTNALIEKINSSGLLPATGKSLQEQFEPFFKQAEEWKAKAGTLIVTSAEQTGLMAQAKEARLALKNIRTTVEKKRKELKEDSLRTGQTIDGVANVIKSLIEPIEAHLEQQEKFVEIEREKALDKLQSSRTEELRKYVADLSFYDLRNMPDYQFENLLNGSKSEYEKRIADEAKAKEDELKRLEDARKEQERMQKENERLRKQTEQAKAKLDKEREEARLKQQQADAKLKQEREEREKLERELKEKKDAEERQKREQQQAEENERKRQQQLERKAKAAPDKEKLIAFSESIKSLKMPEVKSEDAKAIVVNIEQLILKLTTYITTKSNEL